MNAEQLHSLVRQLYVAHAQQKTIKRLTAMRDTLQNVSGNPGNSEMQQAFRDAQASAMDALQSDALTVFSIKDNNILAETGLHRNSGNALAESVRIALDGEQFTPALSIQQLTQIIEALSGRLSMLAALDKNLSELNIGFDEVDAGEAQAGFYIPRQSEDVSFDELIEEEQELEGFVAAATELVTGERRGPTVKLLTASDYGVLLNVTAQVAGFMALAIERALAARKVWLETQLLRRQLAEFGAPAEKMEGLEKHFEAQLDEKVRAAVDDAAAKFALPDGDKHRQNELKNELFLQVRSRIEKMDEGHYIDLKVGLPPPTSAPSEGETVESAQLTMMKEINELTRRLHQLEHEARGQKHLPSPESTTP